MAGAKGRVAWGSWAGELADYTLKGTQVVLDIFRVTVTVSNSSFTVLFIFNLVILGV